MQGEGTGDRGRRVQSQSITGVKPFGRKAQPKLKHTSNQFGRGIKLHNATVPGEQLAIISRERGIVLSGTGNLRGIVFSARCSRPPSREILV